MASDVHPLDGAQGARAEAERAQQGVEARLPDRYEERRRTRPVRDRLGAHRGEEELLPGAQHLLGVVEAPAAGSLCPSPQRGRDPAAIW